MLERWWENFSKKVKKCYRLKAKPKNGIFGDETVPPWIAPIILGVAIALFYAVYLNYEALPSPLYTKDQTDHPNRFIAENAQSYLRNITNLGVRVGGSATNDLKALNLLRELLEEIKLQTNTSAHTLEVLTQNESGDFQLEFSPWGMTTVYRGVINVIAVLSPRGQYSNKCLLLNSHFDTMPDTEGASDAGAMIAVMIEVLRVLATSNQRLEHCIIFLFNGGEENYMLGSHSFITKHDLAKKVEAFINLDAAGSGGREIMFQAGPWHSFLMRYYNKYAPHPHSSVMGEELFQNNLIPSDSDFRIFRDYGLIPGMDFAFNANGFVYHTKYDVEDIIPLGTYQHTGDNILALTRSLALGEHLYNSSAFQDDNVVFYDFLGWFMLFYTMQDAMIINLTICGIGLIVIALSLKSMSNKSGLTVGEMLVEVLISFGIHLVGVGFGVGLVFLLAVLYDAFSRSMAWYSNQWLIFGMYFCPFLFTIGIPLVIWIENFKRGLLSISHQVQLYIHANFFLLILILFVGTLMKIRSSYILLIGVVFYLGTGFINWISGLQNRPHGWMVIHLLGQVMPIMYYGSLVHLAFQTFIPITGRDGPDTNPEYLIAIFSIGMALLMGAFITPLIAICKHPKFVLYFLPLLWFISVIVMISNVGFPYRANTSPQRYWIYHTQRIYNDEHGAITKNESGYFLLAMDRHTPSTVLDILPEGLRKTDEDCDIALYCGLPLLSSRKHSKSDKSYWIPTSEPPNITFETNLSLISSSTSEFGDLKTFDFQITGPNHMAVYLSPFENMKLVNWTYLNNLVPRSGPSWQNNRDTYFIFYNYGHNLSSKFDFSVTIHDPSNKLSEESPCLDIALVSHYLFHQDQRTEEFQSFIDSFPEWTYVQAWTSTYESWRF